MPCAIRINGITEIKKAHGKREYGDGMKNCIPAVFHIIKGVPVSIDFDILRGEFRRIWTAEVVPPVKSRVYIFPSGIFKTFNIAAFVRNFRTKIQLINIADTVVAPEYRVETAAFD